MIAKQAEATSDLAQIFLPLRGGCPIAPSVVCTEIFFESICSLIRTKRTSTKVGSGRTKDDIKAVEKMVELIEDVFTNPWKPNAAFTSLSTGVEATKGVKDDLLQAKAKGKQAANEFVVNRCSSKPTVDYFDPLKKTKLKTFKNLKAVRKVHSKGAVLPLRMDRDVFAWMALIGQFREIDMHENYFLIPTWSTSLGFVRSIWSSAKDEKTVSRTGKAYWSHREISR